MHLIRTLGRLFGFALLTACAARATTHDVGLPAAPLQKLSDVPWAYLQPGDIVNIHAKPGGYHEIIQISASGTAANPILIRGIPDPVTHALPVIDGDSAVMDPHVNFRSSVFEPWGVIIVTPRAAGYVYGKTFPSYITIESLDIRNALYDPTGVRHFTDQHGATRIFDHFACGIYIEFAQHLTIRGCEISNNGNGIFANSKNGPAQCSADLLIEKNYLHDNGQPAYAGLTNGCAEHNIYIESVGVVYQYNRFGSLRPNCHGLMIKDRSSGTVIRYNEVDSATSGIFAILDPQGGAGYIDQQPDYRDAFVYGNIITLLPTFDQTNGGVLVWFAAVNSGSSYATQHRGTLHFYHNTVVSHFNNVGAFFLTDAPYTGGSPTLEKVDARNNVFFTDTAIQNNVYQAFHFTVANVVASVDLGMNWVSPGTQANWIGHGSATVVNGFNQLIVGDYAGKNNPGFASAASLNYHVIGGSDALDAAGPLAPAALAKGYIVDREYLAPQSSQPRITLGNGPDLGALESNAAYLPPPNNHVPTAGAQSFNVVGPVAIPLTLAGSDADGDALTSTITTPPAFGTLTGSAPNLVYTPPVGGGSVVIPYTVSDGYTNSKPGYIFVSYNYPGNPPPLVALTSPAAPVTIAAPGSLTLTANASDTDGIKKVDFFDGPALLGTATTAPYALTVNNLAPGPHHLVAKAFDLLNARTYSAPVTVTVQ